MARRIREHDWAATPLGPIGGWPQSLKTALDVVLAMPGPATILWGPANVQLYNDAYVAVARDRHPALLGRPAAEGWPDAYDEVIAPLLENAHAGGPTRLSDFPVALLGPDGRLEERVFDTDWTPIRDEGGAVAGALQTLTEVTDRHRAQAAVRESEARQSFLLKLSDALRPLGDPEDIGLTAARVLGTHLGASRVAYAEDVGDGQHFEVTRNYVADAEDIVGRFRYTDFGSDLLPELRAGRTRVQPNITADKRLTDAEKEALAAVGVGASLNVPLVKDGRLVAFLGVNYPAAHDFRPAEIELAREVAERTWAAVERARAEATLAASEEKYRSLFDSIDEGLAIVEMIYDDRGEIVDVIFRQVNAAYERQGGIYNVVGRSVSEMLPGVEDVWLDRYEQVARTGRPIRVQDYQQDVGRWFDVYFSRVDKDGRFVAIVFNDISERKRAEAELRASEGRQAFLLKLSDILQRQTEPNEIKTAAMRMLGMHLGVGRAQYHEIDSSGEYYDTDGIGFADGLPLLYGKYRMDQFGSFVAESFEAGRPFQSDDLLTDPRPTAEDREAFATYGVRAGAAIPLLRGGKFVAVLAVHDVRPHPWTDLEMELIRETAERVWVAVEKVRTDVAVRESEERQALLLKLGDRLRTEVDARAIAVTSLGLLADHMRLDRAYVARVDKGRDLAEIGPEHRRPDLAPVEGVLTLSDFPEAFARVEAATLVLADAAADPTLSDGDRRGFAGLRMGALIVASARKGTRNPIWALLVATEEPRRWTAAEVALVEETAERTWAAMERARAEAALREGEERNRLIVEGARDYAIITTDPEGRIASWSAGAEAVLGWGAEEALGRPAAITFVPEDREAGEPEEELATARRHGSARDVRWHLRKDGSRVFIEGTTRALRAGDGGELRGFLKVGQDVTERRRAEEALRASEEKYRTLVENVGDHAVFMLDAEGRVTEWTESARRVKGYEAEEVVGRHFSLFHAPEGVAAGEPGRELAEAAREGRAEREGWRVRKDGERIWVNEIATAVRDGEGDLVGFAKIARDLTERRELERERELARARELTALAEAAERERISRELHDRVAHHMGVAHQSLELFAALKEAAPGRAEEKLALARETTRLALDQTRALSAELKRLQEEELEEGLGAALRALGATMSDGVEVGVRSSGDESAVPKPVALQVYLAMREAVRNATRHSGGSRVGVELDVSDGEVVGSVEDDGKGFDPEAVGKASPSWGVGLRSMRERSEMLGGSTRVESAPGAGTRVEVRVPLDGRRPS